MHGLAELRAHLSHDVIGGSQQGFHAAAIGMVGPRRIAGVGIDQFQ